MSLINFFLKNQIISSTLSLHDDSEANDLAIFKLQLSNDDLHHAKVLRLHPGEYIGVVDADSVYYKCQITSINDDGLFVKISSKGDKSTDNVIKITLCPGLLKQNKLDEVIKSCTEIGISGFMPILFKRTVVNLNDVKMNKRIKRWKTIAKSASMQSGQIAIPKIFDIKPLNALSDFFATFDLVIIFWEGSDVLCSCEQLAIFKNKLIGLSKTISIAVVIGPEGGISQSEIKLLKSFNANTSIYSLGNNILTAPTASIYVSSILDFVFK